VKRVSISTLGLVLLAFFPASSLAWGPVGHQTVAEVAFNLLSNNVRSKVTAILGSESIQHAALWPDLLRDAPSNDVEMRQFINAHPDHASWHFVNLPLQTTTYAPSGSFARPNDIVHQINLCIDVLEGQSTVLTQRHALRWLVHLVGDLHQPLHVGCGFYRFDADRFPLLLKTPSEASGQQHDRGGNRLFYTRLQTLHGYWDTALVDRLVRRFGEANFVNTIRSNIKPGAFQTSGPIPDWATQWAIDSVKEARGAYAGIKFGEAEFRSDGELDSIIILRSKKYGENQETRAARQLAKGAFHLAELLNRIQWP
jgi:hypothetical protein